MIRISSYEVPVKDLSILMPVSGAILAIELFSSGVRRWYSTHSLSDNLVRFDFDTCAKLEAGNAYRTTGDVSILDSSFVKGDSVSVDAIAVAFPELPDGDLYDFRARLLVVDYVREQVCNCNH